MGSRLPLFSARHATTLLDGAARGRGDIEFSAVCVDSRNASPGSLFVALPGERTDGHRYVREALGRGASGVLVSEAGLQLVQDAATLGVDFPGTVCVVVPDTLAALQRLAAVHRERMQELRVIGVTGSNGKTTTKELIGAVMKRHQPTFVSEGNLNSDIGLPLSVFGIEAEHRVAVLEMGMNRIGEMGQLAAIARPDLAVITNIGTAHIGKIGSRDQIINEKKAITAQFRGTELLLIWEDEPAFSRLAEGVNGTVQPYGPRSTDGWQGSTARGLAGSILQWRDRTIRLALPGEHSVRNALAAIHIATIYGVADAEVVDALESVRPLFGRGQIIEGDVSAVVDCYNANPESMQSALRFAASTETGGRRIAVLGAMKELGEHAAEAHRAVIREAIDAGMDVVLLLGQEFAPGALEQGDRRVQYFRSFEELLTGVRETVCAGDLVLIKGSRSLELERLVPYITGEKV